MQEIHDAIAHVEGWKEVSRECLGNMSVSLFLNWSDPCDTSSDDESGGSHNQSEASSSDSDDASNSDDASDGDDASDSADATETTWP